MKAAGLAPFDDHGDPIDIMSKFRLATLPDEDLEGMGVLWDFFSGVTPASTNQAPC